MIGGLTAAPRDLSEPVNPVLVASGSQLFPFLRTIHNELDTPEGEPVTPSSDDLFSGITPVRSLAAKVFHPIDAQLRRRISGFCSERNVQHARRGTLSGLALGSKALVSVTWESILYLTCGRSQSCLVPGGRHGRRLGQLHAHL
jgi:hypothetical protein